MSLDLHADPVDLTAALVDIFSGSGAEAGKLEQAVGSFRGAGCTTVPAAGGACSQALVDIAGALAGLKKQVDARPTSG